MLADLFLAEKPTVAEANGGYAVNPGGSVTFSSTGSYDPDSITWNSSGSYSNNGGSFNGTWDLDGDGTYETTGASPTLSHAQLVSLVSYTEGKTITLRVADTDPGVYQKNATDTATIAVYSNPTADALMSIPYSRASRSAGRRTTETIALMSPTSRLWLATAMRRLYQSAYYTTRNRGCRLRCRLRFLNFAKLQ